MSAAKQMRPAHPTWDVWVAGEVTRCASARQALDLYAERCAQHGTALVSLERDGWSSLSAAYAAAECEEVRS